MRVRVAAILVHEGRILLVSTKRGAAGHLVPPGGGVEEGETVAAAVEREVAEEAGLRVRAGALLAYRELNHAGALTLELYLRAALIDRDTGASPEGRGVHWVPCVDLPAYPHFPEALAELARRAQVGAPEALYLGVARL